MYIYKITNTINNKIYIGLSTKSVEKSTNYLGSGEIQSRAIKKYGKENFIKEILEDGISCMQILSEREIYWINEYNSTDHSIGYNITKGGEGFRSNHTQEAKDKIRKFYKGKSYEELFGDMAEAEKLKRKKVTRTPEQYKVSAKKMGITQQGVPKPFKTVECPHCFKKGKENIIYRWHFDNCKNKIK
jgi:group I intron endonuclease